ncbi:hypothetical protein C2S53_010815, partial [Perilla frutescens var. hirtella]
MRENTNQIVHGKLNLNVPPLSTRRAPGTTVNSGSRPEPANMVPFSWERIPGEPKDRAINENSGGIEWLPPPKPPPGRWQPPPRGDDECSDDEKNSPNEHFSDAIDIFSLAESVDDVEGYCKATKDRSSAMMEASDHDAYFSPNFIIERFLPDAQALAEESVMNKKAPFSSSPRSDSASFSRAVSIGRSMKGCGLSSFLPWKMKPKPCSVKSP